MKGEMLEQVLAYVDAHIHDKISLCTLSEMAGYTPFYFSTIFSKAMGMPVTAYIRIRKLQHAIVSLLEGNKVLDVALLYAFDSHEGFTRAFTQLFGSTPSTVRRHLVSYTVPKYAVPTTYERSVKMEILNVDTLKRDMHQLVFVFLEQSLAEAEDGYCTKIEIILLPGVKVRINDNGRGIPLPKDLYAGKAVLDKILAGKPIANAEYSQMGDLLLADMQTVNSLCEGLQIIVTRDKTRYRQDYTRGIAQHELEISESAQCSGTEIILKPDSSIFTNMEFSIDLLRDWIDKKRADHANLNILITDKTVN